MLCLFAGRHDFDVLQCVVRRVVVSVAAGDAGAVTDGHGVGGQLCQALVLTVHRQLVCQTQDTINVTYEGAHLSHAGRQISPSVMSS